MKRMIVLMLVMTLSLTGCGKSPSASEVSLEKFSPATLTALVDVGAFSEELEELDADTAFALYHLADYGLEREDLVDAAVLRSAGATCEEAAVLIFEEEKQTDNAVNAMTAYKESQIESNQSYRPEEIPKLEYAILMVRENAVLFVVADDLKAAEPVFCS